MELSDILTLIEIGVTIIVGFYLTHLFSVKDARTRALKDYYIDQAKNIHLEVIKFFSHLFADNAHGRELTTWYKSHKTRFNSFDDGIASAFDIDYIRISDILFDIHKNVTGLEEFNNGFSAGRFNFSPTIKLYINSQEQNAINAINDLVLEINNSSSNNIILRYWKKIRYYCCLEKNRLLQLAKRLLFLGIKCIVVLAICFGTYYLFKPVCSRYTTTKEEEEKKKDSLINEAFTIMNTQNTRLDSIDSDLKQIKGKMRIRKGVVNHYIHTNCLP